MKTRIAILMSLLLMTIGSYARPKQPKNELVVKWVKKQILYFKVNKNYVGGTVAVYDEKSKLLETDKLSHSHTMVYFDEAPAGRYTIRVTKGKKKIEFRYTNIHLVDSLSRHI